MRAYLVQHGEARSKDVDPERRLTEKGVRDVEKVSCFLEPLGLCVSAVWHSGKARAAQTAEILGRSVKAARGAVAREGLAPNDPVGPVKEEIAGAQKDLMVVGHLPFLARLASSLVADESTQVVAFRQGGVVCLERDEEGSWSVVWAVVPDLLP